MTPDSTGNIEGSAAARLHCAQESTGSVAAPRSQPSAGSEFQCMLCGASQSTPVITGCKDLYLCKPYVADYHRCVKCGLVQQHPLPADVAPFYEAYPVHEKRSRAYSHFRRTLLSGVYLDPAKWPKNTVLLDFGCGDGWYLEWCKESGITAIGFEADVTHATRLSRALGLPVLSDLAALTQEYDGAFDVITFHFVVEHLTDIRGTLSRARRLLKPGGVIRYVVPNIDSWEFRLFGRRWHSLDPPRHISFPDARHAQRLAKDLSLVYAGEESVSFANGFGGSIPTLLTGRFRPLLYFATLPLSLPVTWLFPSGNHAYRLALPSRH